MIDVWDPKKLREHYCFVDNIISAVYELCGRKFRSIQARKIQNNASMHKSRDTLRQ